MSDDIKTRLLDAAQLLVQTHGHNGYSYRDLATQVGIRTASIHYHFPAKTDLAVALVRRYYEFVSTAMKKIEGEHTSLAKRLEGVAAIYSGCLSANHRICVASALAAEYSSLPREVQEELNRLITDSQGWIAHFFEEGKKRGEILPARDPAALARLWYAALQGALVVARATDTTVLADVTNILEQLTIQG